MSAKPILDWRGQRVWIIGASHGIGHALSVELYKKGALLALSGRDKTRLEALKDTLAGSLLLPLDVTNPEDVHQAARQLQEHWTHLDVVIHCAGDYRPMSSAEADFEKARQIVNVNFMSYFHLFERVLPWMMKKRSGHIIMVGSVAGYVGLPNGFGYCASKAAVMNLAESMKIELEPEGIDVRLVSPGFVKSRLTDLNTFSMPFLLSVEDASQAIIKGLSTKSFEIHFPYKFTLLLKFLRIMPRSIRHRILRLMADQPKE